MVNVFYNHAFVCGFTTAILYFLQVINVNAAESDPESSFYECSDGKRHTITNKTYQLKNSRGMSSDPAPMAAIYVEKKGTVVDASQVTVIGDKPSVVFSYGGYVQDGGELIFTDSNFKDMPSLRAHDGVIKMTGGKIEGTSHAIHASGKETDVSLDHVDIEIAPDNLNIEGIAIVSGFDAMVRMSNSTVTFNEIGSFSTRFGGNYFLDNMIIKGEGKKKRSKVNARKKSIMPEAFEMFQVGNVHLRDNTLQQAFEVFQGGNVHLRDSTLQLTDMHGFLIKNYSGYAYANGQLIAKYGIPRNFKNTNIQIENSHISMQGESAHGLYFHILDPEEAAIMLSRNDEKLSDMRTIIMGVASVSLSNTTFSVPDGMAIYATGTNGYGAKGTLELSEETKVSGDLLLKAENNASLFVKASASSLIGGARVEDISTARLELTHGSTWVLKKRKQRGLQGLDSTDSSLSSLSLSDSTLIFDEDTSDGYQTLRIGKETEINEKDKGIIKEKVIINEEDKITLSKYEQAYSAQGNVQIRLSAFLDDHGSFDPQKTDRILIYGDVSGTTVVHMQNFKKTSGQEVRDGRGQSISLIQVSGIAKEDSFKLANSYTTVDGLPYQYRLRGYGPGSPFGEADAAQRLVAGDGKFWDFRLEAIYINPETDSSETTPVSPAAFSAAPSDTIDPQPTDLTSTPSPVAPSVPVEPSPTAPMPELSVPSSSSTPSPVALSDTIDPQPTDLTSTPSPVAPSVPVEPSPTAPMPELSVRSSSSTPSPVALSDTIDLQPTDSTPTSSVSVKSRSVRSIPVKPDIQTEPKIRAVVPQLPTYLLLPNALFHAGFMDLTTQNKKLETIRNSSVSSLKSHENSAFFVRGYGGSYHYASNLSAFEYGYGAELDYSAFEAGVLLKKTDRTNSRAFFGIMGTYGSLSLHPLNVEQSKKSTFDRWSVSAYGSLQDDTGFYVDGLLSHGLFKGDVFTLARDKVATLKGKQSNASLTSGQRFAIGHTGFIFDPQFQLIYQRLQFDHVRDVDNLDVDLGKFNQWTARVGGRLTKILTPSEKERIVSFYGKLYFSRNFGDRHFVSFKNDFQLGAFGSSLEAGVGFNAQLSAKFVLHGDVNYQHRLTKAGFSGANFSAGFRHLF
ncbi:autotransporter outer membrane beta-barrel domain-containing protein [Bartonella vinsonii]|uniref:Type V secretory pathway, adhesin AidA n=1 Tax=Bartonella vinsonii TaxID=33047 RepID=A0A448V7V8_BARVI|nr:autotransporter outer membrane beta-barrel domain-containing protein [Bartonella vinsonii]VEJ45853.1 Type V secretory pathway, adhesin AidA [Bartonella vinsonii]